MSDTVRYLSTNQEIKIPNQRGRIFNLAGRSFKRIIKVIGYISAQPMSPDCRSTKCYVSEVAGFIHIVDLRDYLEIARTLRVPQEAVKYFEYREAVLTQFAQALDDIPEPAIAGHFIGGDPSQAPTMESVQYLHRLVRDDEQWDLMPLLRGMHDHILTEASNGDYYDILLEIAKLPRSGWREIRKRIKLSVENVQRDEFVMPYRLAYPETECGFVFIPMTSVFTADPNWPEIRRRALENMTRAHKYDQRLKKCIGILVSKSGEFFEIFWSLLAHEWREDPEMRQALDANFPFRPVRQGQVYGYMLTDD
jgi:hypothetical protein